MYGYWTDARIDEEWRILKDITYMILRSERT